MTDVQEDWGTCKLCNRDIDFRGYCTDNGCHYFTHFQSEEAPFLRRDGYIDWSHATRESLERSLVRSMRWQLENTIRQAAFLGDPRTAHVAHDSDAILLVEVAGRKLRVTIELED